MTNKITKTIIKSFIKKNLNNLYIRTNSDLKGMTDCVELVEDEFKKVQGNYNPQQENTLGLGEVWFVGQSRDRIVEFNSKDFKGFTVTNSCGSWTVAIKNITIEQQKGGNDMTNLTELQSKFINNIPKEGTVNKKDFLDYLETTSTMNKMQAGACITTLRKKGYIEFDGKIITLIHQEDESNILRFNKQEEAPKKRRGRPKKAV